MKLQDRRQRLAFAINEVSEKSHRLRRVANQARDIEKRVASAVLGTFEDTNIYSEDGSMEKEHQAVAFYQKA